MLRIDGHFSGRVTSLDGTLIVVTARNLRAVIEVAVAKDKWNCGRRHPATKELILGCTANVTGEVIAPALTSRRCLLNANCRRR